MKIFTYFLAIALGITFSINAMIPDELEELNHRFNTIKKEHDIIRTHLPLMNEVLGLKAIVSNAENEKKYSENHPREYIVTGTFLARFIHELKEDNPTYMLWLYAAGSFCGVTSLAIGYYNKNINHKKIKEYRGHIKEQGEVIDQILYGKESLKPMLQEVYDTNPHYDEGIKLSALEPVTNIDLVFPACITRYQLKTLHDNTTDFKQEIHDILQKVTAECQKKYDSLEKHRKYADEKPIH